MVLDFDYRKKIPNFVNDTSRSWTKCQIKSFCQADQ